jgi:hypothetical protein
VNLNVVFLSLALALSNVALGSMAYAEDEEIELDIPEAESTVPETSDENVSFDDFDSPAAQAESIDAPTEAPQDEMSLEPLKGDENQVSEEEPVLDTPTPAELQPEPAPTAPEVADTSPAIEGDAPDLDIEARLYDIYINFNSKKMSEEEWSRLIGARESESYQIQAGDTLWGISQTFFNDGNYWPKIWQLNSSIDNPHLIKPGYTIQFLLGTESETPAFSVTEEAQPPVEMPVGDAGAAGAAPPAPEEPAAPVPTPGATAAVDDGTPQPGAVEIPDPTFYPPVLKRLPPSLAEALNQARSDKYDDAGIDYGRRPILDLSEKKFLESFIDTEDFQADGVVSEIEGGGLGASKFQYVFVSLPAGEGKPGERYAIVQKAGQLERVNDEIASSDLGYQYQYRGEVQLSDLLTTRGVVQKLDIFRAQVVESLGHITPGTFAIHGRLPVISVVGSGERNDVMTQIVGGHVLKNQETLSLHNLAYLSSGVDQGLKEGQILTVRANTKLRNPKSLIEESYIPVGQLRVVQVGKRFSTAVVTRVWDRILIGDVTGAGKVLPPSTDRSRARRGSEELELPVEMKKSSGQEESDPDLEL